MKISWHIISAAFKEISRWPRVLSLPPTHTTSRAATASSCVKQQLPIPLPLPQHSSRCPSPSHIRITYANLFILFILCHHVPPTCPLPFALSAAAPSVPALLLSPCPSSTSSSLFFRLSSSVSMCELWPFVCCFCLSFVCLFACLCVVCLPRMLTHSHTHSPSPSSSTLLFFCPLCSCGFLFVLRLKQKQRRVASQL